MSTNYKKFEKLCTNWDKLLIVAKIFFQKIRTAYNF